MSAQLKRKYTLDEYFELEHASEEKYEYFDGEIFCMSGASPKHERVLMDTTVSLNNKLSGSSCQLFSSNVRVKVPNFPPYRYPDLSATCEEPRYEVIGGLETLVNPSLIIEVLSPSTEGYDRGDKFTHYKSIETFAEYVLIAQHRPHVTHYVKDASGTWAYEELNNLDDMMRFATLDCELSLREIYRNVAFPPPGEQHDLSSESNVA